jgi:Ser/Thr protein kinase RdoA (MazF antagonist)
MDPQIAKRYNNHILSETTERFGIKADKIKLLDGFESFIYSFSTDDGEFILRIGHSLRRTKELIQGEVDWINYLAAGGADVAKAILSSNGRLVEFIDDNQGERFMATAFVNPGMGSFAGEDSFTFKRL